MSILDKIAVVPQPPEDPTPAVPEPPEVPVVPAKAPDPEPQPSE
jgi:hypothetical protein